MKVRFQPLFIVKFFYLYQSIANFALRVVVASKNLNSIQNFLNEWKSEWKTKSFEAKNLLIVAMFSVFTQPIFYLVKNGLHQCVPEKFPVKNNMLFSWKTKEIMMKTSKYYTV